MDDEKKTYIYIYSNTLLLKHIVNFERISHLVPGWIISQTFGPDWIISQTFGSILDVWWNTGEEWRLSFTFGKASLHTAKSINGII